MFTVKSKSAAALFLSAVMAVTPAAGAGQYAAGLVALADSTGTVTASSLNLRSGPGTGYASAGRLSRGSGVNVIGQTNGADGKLWYQVSCGNLSGYVSAEYVRMGASGSGTRAVSDGSFESFMENQGFPESYKPLLRELHASYPGWTFKAYQTGLDWNTVLAEETVVGRNVVQANNISSWKSTEKGAYDWNTGTWPSFDSGSWAAASAGIISYYLDPRNFMNSQYIFQFLDQSYDEQSQTRDGLMTMLSGTFLAGAVPGTQSGTNSGSENAQQSASGDGPATGPGLESGSGAAPGNVTEILTAPGQQGTGDMTGTQDSGQQTAAYYADILMDAGRSTGVSPYVLASMILQEQGYQGKGRSVSGTVSGYEGIYNFFNINAYASDGMSAVERGLNWAAQSGSYGRPWNSVRSAIMGGAAWYGENYVKKGQATLYLKKYNVTANNRYKHQYMTNTLAAAAEGLSMAKITSLYSMPLTFSIPVYSGMPASPNPKPVIDGSPNNKLRYLGVSGFVLTPTFDMDVNDYSLVVDSSVASVTVDALAIDGKAQISGGGQISLGSGGQDVTITVKAENGDVRSYRIHIARSAGGSTYDAAQAQNSAQAMDNPAVGPGAEQSSQAAQSGQQVIVETRPEERPAGTAAVNSVQAKPAETSASNSVQVKPEESTQDTRVTIVAPKPAGSGRTQERPVSGNHEANPSQSHSDDGAEDGGGYHVWSITSPDSN